MGYGTTCGGAAHRRFAYQDRRRHVSASRCRGTARPRLAHLLALSRGFRVPPTFDFAGSQNVELVNVFWLAPDRFPDGAGGYFIGYKGNIIFPLRVVPKDAANDLSIHLKLTYAVCEKLCVPADADLKLNLTGSSAQETAIEKAELRVPNASR